MGGPLTILHVVVNMNRGGAETFIMNLYRNIDRTKVQFDFLTFKPGVFDQEIQELGGKVHRIPYVTEVGHHRFIKQLNQFMDRNNHYKIVHSHMDKMSGFITKAAKKANIPIRISHSHNTNSEGGILSKVYKGFSGIHILSNSTHLYACSEAAAKWLFKHKATQATILNNGIEMGKFKFSSSIRKMKKVDLTLENDSIVIGHVGRFTEQKNHIFLLDIVAILKEIIPNVKLVLVGDGPLQKVMEKKVEDLKLENHVEFLGIRSDIHELLQVFDLFLMPSHHEGLPLTLIEAQSAGLPCLISNKITVEADMKIGLVHFLPIINPHDWVVKIMNLLNNHDATSRVIENTPIDQAFNITKTATTTANAYITLGSDAI